MEIVVSADDSARLLMAVSKAAKKIETGRAERLAAIREAAEAGVPISHIAQAADLSRKYIYSLLESPEV